jgi:hypothetical protein
VSLHEYTTPKQGLKNRVQCDDDSRVHVRDSHRLAGRPPLCNLTPAFIWGGGVTIGNR